MPSRSGRGLFARGLFDGGQWRAAPFDFKSVGLNQTGCCFLRVFFGFNHQPGAPCQFRRIAGIFQQADYGSREVLG